MRLLIRLLLLGGLVYLAFRYLPAGVAAGLVAVVVAPVVAIRLLLRSMGTMVRGALGDVIPQKMRKSLRAGRRFEGRGFAFTLPVPALVEQVLIQDLEALMIRPRLKLPGNPAQEVFLVASTMSQDEVKTRINAKLEGAFAQLPVNVEQEITPVQVGPLSGERRAMAAEKDGKAFRGEAVFLGDASYSIAWAAASEAGGFEPLAERMRELALLIERKAPAAEAPERA